MLQPRNVKTTLYADDLLIITMRAYVSVIERRLQHAIDRIDNWNIEQDITISTDKIVAMHFHHKRGLLMEPSLKIIRILVLCKKWNFYVYSMTRNYSGRSRLSTSKESAQKSLISVRFCPTRIGVQIEWPCLEYIDHSFVQRLILVVKCTSQPC